jgi:hypothetical protein
VDQIHDVNVASCRSHADRINHTCQTGTSGGQPTEYVFTTATIKIGLPLMISHCTMSPGKNISSLDIFNYDLHGAIDVVACRHLRPLHPGLGAYVHHFAVYTRQISTAILIVLPMHQHRVYHAKCSKNRTGCSRMYSKNASVAANVGTMRNTDV